MQSIIVNEANHSDIDRLTDIFISSMLHDPLYEYLTSHPETPRSGIREQRRRIVRGSLRSGKCFVARIVSSQSSEEDQIGAQKTGESKLVGLAILEDQPTSKEMKQGILGRLEDTLIGHEDRAWDIINYRDYKAMKDFRIKNEGVKGAFKQNMEHS